MGRVCSQCNYHCDRHDFSANQWRKGAGYSRCSECVHGSSQMVFFQCHECHRQFNTQNELNMHMQVHRPRNVSCPVCGETRFRSGANAVQHVESGYCRGCRGRENARQQIYNYASSQSQMRPYMTDRPMLTNGSSQHYVPDFPYQCSECNKQFRQLSQLLQHRDQKHNNYRMIGY